MDSSVSVSYDPVSNTISVKAFNPHYKGWQGVSIPATSKITIKDLSPGDDKIAPVFLLQTSKGMVQVIKS